MRGKGFHLTLLYDLHVDIPETSPAPIPLSNRDNVHRAWAHLIIQELEIIVSWIRITPKQFANFGSFSPDLYISFGAVQCRMSATWCDIHRSVRGNDVCVYGFRRNFYIFVAHLVKFAAEDMLVSTGGNRESKKGDREDMRRELLL